MSFWQWSKVASNNGTADASINLSEGMSPSSVNDSARAMMARAAEYRDDISGSITTGGTATAFTITTNQGLAATPQDGQLIAFTMSLTNGPTPTLAADGGTAFPIQTAAGSAVASGTLILGTPYTAKFSNSASSWVLRDFYGSPFSVPVGAIMPYTGTTAPNSNFVIPHGQAISRTTYATYFAMVGTTYGAGDGTTTFNVPNLSGRVIAGIDGLGGAATGTLTTTYFGSDPTVLGNVGGAQNHTLTTAELPVTTPAGTIANVITPSPAYVGVQSVGAGAGATPSPAASGTLAVASTFAGTPFGSGTPHAIVQPTIILSYILRIL